MVFFRSAGGFSSAARLSPVRTLIRLFHQHVSTFPQLTMLLPEATNDPASGLLTCSPTLSYCVLSRSFHFNGRGLGS